LQERKIASLKASNLHREIPQACSGKQTFGEARFWLRPRGFAHPVDVEEVTSPEDMPDTS
jgi:hypothetical protein